MSTSSLPPFGFSPGAVGPVIQADGSPARERMGKDGAQIVQDGHARYQEPNYRGNMFYCANTAAQALTLSGTTTYTGLTLANPSNSGKNLVLISAIWGTTITPTAAGAVILATGAAAAQTAGNSGGATTALIGGGFKSVANVGASCTYAANPTFLRPFLGVPWVSAAGNGNGGLQYKDEIAGELILAPGNQVSFLAVTTAITGIGFFSWEEIPV